MPDLRGMGLSAHPDTGYTKKNQALDIVGVMDALKIESADLVTHDIGDMVGYALAAQYPSRITKWVVIDAPLPGIGIGMRSSKARCSGTSISAARTRKGWWRGASASIWTDSMMSCPRIRRRSTRRRAATMPRFTRGRTPCMTPSNSLVRSIRTQSITRRCLPKAASSRYRSWPWAGKNPSAPQRRKPALRCNERHGGHRPRLWPLDHGREPQGDDRVDREFPVEQAGDRNVTRCGGHPDHCAGALRADEPMSVPTAKPS